MLLGYFGIVYVRQGLLFISSKTEKEGWQAEQNYMSQNGTQETT